MLKPEDFGFAQSEQSELFGGASVEASAKIFVDILEGKGTNAQNNAILANAGLAIQTVNPELSLQDAIAQATDSLQSGKALKVLTTLQAL